MLGTSALLSRAQGNDRDEKSKKEELGEEHVAVEEKQG